jgi:hypothetical protein
VQIEGCCNKALINAMEYLMKIEDVSVLDECNTDSGIESEYEDEIR